MSPSLWLPACPAVTNNRPSCNMEWPEQKMLYGASGGVLKLLVTGFHSVGLFPLPKDGQKSTLPFESRCA
jgi:hypothetical protein